LTNGDVDINNRLFEIKETLIKISNTLHTPYKEKEWTESVKSILTPFAAILVFLWGLLNLRTAEARAKMAYIAPLIQKSSQAIESAYTKLTSNMKLEVGDISGIIEPIVKIEGFLNEKGLVELIVESNRKTFELARMTMPSNVLTEINERGLLTKFLSYISSATLPANMTKTLNSQYNSALTEVIGYDKKGTNPKVLLMRTAIALVFISVLLIFLFANAA